MAALVFGVFFIAFAAFVSNGVIERALLGASTASLAWGPTAFRAILGVHGLLLVMFGLLRRRPQSPPTPAVAAEGHSDWRPWAVLSVVTVVALALRLWHLNSCLWFDELITLKEFALRPLGNIVTSYAWQNQHMLYSVLARLSVASFGESAWAVRLPSVVLGVGSLWALYLLGRRLLGNVETLLACALMAVSYHHIWFSQNARGYMGMLFFATLATWFWLEATSRHELKWYVLYSVAAALGMWVHMTMVFVVIAHAMIHLVWLFRRGTKSAAAVSTKTGLWQYVLAYGLSATITLQLYALALPQFFSQAAKEGVATKSEWTNPFWVVAETLRGLQVGWSGAFVVLCGALLVGAGWFGIFRKDARAAFAFVLPGLLGAAAMLTLGHPLWPRFFLFSLGFALLTVVHGAMVVARVVVIPLGEPARLAWGTRLGIAAAALMIVASIFTLPRYYALPKQDFTGARDYVESNRRPGESVVAVGLAGVAYKAYYSPAWLKADTRAELEQVRAENRDLWLVYTIPAQIRSLDPEFWRVIEDNFRVVRVFHGTLGDGDVVVCRSNQRATSAKPITAEPTRPPKQT